MSYVRPVEPEGEEPPLPVPGLGYRSAYVSVVGVLISFYDHPECVYSDDHECGFCEFFVPEDCPILRYPSVANDIRSLFQLYREYLGARRTYVRKVVRAIRSELRAYGRPLHYMVLARMVGDRHPELQVTGTRVLRIMSDHPEEFERVVGGVYQVRR